MTPMPAASVPRLKAIWRPSGDKSGSPLNRRPGAFASSARSDPSTPIATISPSTWNASRPARAAAVGAIASRPSTAHRSPRPIDATVVNGRAVRAG
jgi:hypothetical protein